MHTIGIIGATGSVGTELCVTLRLFKDVRVVAICRSELAAVLLKRCGVECRVGFIEDRRQAEHLLAECDTVVDLSLPRGTASEFRRSSADIIENAITFSPPGARFVYASTYMAYGMKEPEDRLFRRYRFSRNVYGTNKRWAEHRALSAAKRSDTPAYVLRFGQVQGEIQRCTHRLVVDAKASVHVPASASNTVFVFTVAEAIVHIAHGLEGPGVYTLVSVPQWSWKEVVEYVSRRNGIRPTVVEVSRDPVQQRRSAFEIPQMIVRALLRNRDLVTGYILAHFPKLEMRAKALHSIRRARAEIASARVGAEVELLESVYWGGAPGRRLTSLSDSRTSMEPYAAVVRQIFEGVIQSSSSPHRAGAE